MPLSPTSSFSLSFVYRVLLWWSNLPFSSLVEKCPEGVRMKRGEEGRDTEENVKNSLLVRGRRKNGTYHSSDSPGAKKGWQVWYRSSSLRSEDNSPTVSLAPKITYVRSLWLISYCTCFLAFCLSDQILANLVSCRAYHLHKLIENPDPKMEAVAFCTVCANWSEQRRCSEQQE